MAPHGLFVAKFLLLIVPLLCWTASSLALPAQVEDELRSMTHEELVQLEERVQQLLQQQTPATVTTVPPPAHSRVKTALPRGSYQKSCRNCTRYGDSLWCNCLRNATGPPTFDGPVVRGGWKQTAISLSACVGGENATITESANGYLWCDWVGAPPPRVGDLTGVGGSASDMCRYMPHTTFVAPQFKSPSDPMATHILKVEEMASPDMVGDEPNVEPKEEAAKCCALCRNHSKCKGWTITNLSPPSPPPVTDPSGGPPPPGGLGSRACLLVSQVSTLMPSLSSYSGYPVKSDPGSWCQHVEDNRGNGQGVVRLDRGVPSSVSCGQIPPKRGKSGSNATGFPRAWGSGRGTAWLFYPKDSENPAGSNDCSCVRTNSGGKLVPGSMTCTGPTFDAGMIAQHIKGKKWAVFIHGGEFLWSSNIDSGYAILAAQMAEEGTGILAVDYRLGGFAPYPAAINDAIQALEWLQLHGAGSISLLGDSSGGTQVMETLLLLAHRQNLGQPTVKIDAAVCFSAWLDLTCANPGYRTEQYCTGACLNMGSPDAGMNTAGWDAVMGQCAARSYAGKFPISHPLLSPVHAGPELLARLPPTLLIVGGTEILMPETLEMAANAQAAGAPVSARVYAGMWHCFQEYSQGCGNSAKEPLAAGLDAMRVAREFLLSPTSLTLSREGEGGDVGGGWAPVSWVSNFTKRPPVTEDQC